MVLVWELQTNGDSEACDIGRRILAAVRRMCWLLTVGVPMRLSNLTMKKIVSKQDAGRGDLFKYFHRKIMQGDSTSHEW